MKHKLGRILTYIIFFFALTLPTHSFAERASLEQCRQFSETNNGTLPETYNDALLWQVQKPGIDDSYVFGTIHVSDPRVLDLPISVRNALASANTFIMELIPSKSDQQVLKEAMFYPEGQSLKDVLDDELFQATESILKKYLYSSDTVSNMRPWAAYLTMNYPSNTSLYLDLLLLNLAKGQEKKLIGLETLEEQLSILSRLPEKEQLQLLLDAVCNYDDIEQGFEKMIELYLQRDLKGLFRFNNTTMLDEKLYKDLFTKILNDRNHIMIDRMSQHLKAGRAFVAVGAMHLAGKEGLLSLLKQQGYTLNPLY